MKAMYERQKKDYLKKLQKTKTFDPGLPSEEEEQEAAKIRFRLEAARREHSAADEEGHVDFVARNRASVRAGARRPRSACVHQEISHPKTLAASKIVRSARLLLARHAREGRQPQLDLSSFRMDAQGLAFVCACVGEEGLERLCLANCGLVDEVLAPLPQVLMDLGEGLSLRVLELGINGISPEGAAGVCDWLRWDICLHTLDLQLNALGDRGCTHIARALERNRTLKVLNLQGNGITAEGVSLIARALNGDAQSEEQKIEGRADFDLGPARLEVLFLGYNPLGDEGVEILAGVVRDTAALHTLCLTKVGMGDGTAQLLAELIEDGDSSLERLDVSYNDIRCETVDRLASKKVLWVQRDGFEPVTALPTAGDSAMCDAKEYFCRRGPLESNERKRMAQEAHDVSRSSRAAHAHIAEWRKLPPRLDVERREKTMSTWRTDTLLKEPSMGALYGGFVNDLPDHVYGGGRELQPHGHNRFGPLNVYKDNNNIQAVPKRGPLRHNDRPMAFMEHAGERGTVYGNIGGDREGIVAVARGVGNGKAINVVNRRGLKCAPVGLWQGKG